MKYLRLSDGDHACVDDEDYDYVTQFRWHVRRCGVVSYARRMAGVRPDRKNVYLHQDILGTRDGFVIDHIDGNGLNCCRANLRFATVQQNNLNRRARGSQYTSLKGVSWDVRKHSWRAQIGYQRNKIYLGLFDDPLAAARAYDAAAIRLFGEFARTNF